ADETGQTSHYVGTFKDITNQKLTEKKLEKLAYYDLLTNLPNRALFREKLRHELAVSDRKSYQVAVLFLDLDRFKQVNDSLGHDAGDRLLIEVASRLTSCVRSSDTVARIGGDEFTIILNEVTDINSVALVAQSIIAEVEKTFLIAGNEAYVGASIGISLYPSDATDLDSVIKCADTAMYESKAAGRGTYQFFTTEMNAINQKRIKLENHLRKALEKGEFTLYYQGKTTVHDLSRTGFEALIRWNNPELGSISPEEFIPIAEEIGVIQSLSTWVINQACAQAAAWKKQGYGNFNIAINLSGKEFSDANLTDKISEALQEHGLTSDFISIEITEGILMENIDMAVKTLKNIKKLGVEIALDDFGTGYSSLSYLKKFPIDYLKIDKSFVQSVFEDPESEVIVEAILSLAHSLKLKVIAEGVETKEQFDFLAKRNCHLIQGYYFSHPCPANEIIFS
ncbi:MAG: EAL domain-containing protein, partial [SAR324 cluster bacterium]|nr:EAL domain-containing protein [SAR324 cluster bacterium]